MSGATAQTLGASMSMGGRAGRQAHSWRACKPSGTTAARHGARGTPSCACSVEAPSRHRAAAHLGGVQLDLHPLQVVREVVLVVVPLLCKARGWA